MELIGSLPDRPYEEILTEKILAISTLEKLYHILFKIMATVGQMIGEVTMPTGDILTIEPEFFPDDPRRDSTETANMICHGIALRIRGALADNVSVVLQEDPPKVTAYLRDTKDRFWTGERGPLLFAIFFLQALSKDLALRQIRFSKEKLHIGRPHTSP